MHDTHAHNDVSGAHCHGRSGCRHSGVPEDSVIVKFAMRARDAKREEREMLLGKRHVEVDS